MYGAAWSSPLLPMFDGKVGPGEQGRDSRKPKCPTFKVTISKG